LRNQFNTNIAVSSARFCVNKYSFLLLAGKGIRDYNGLKFYVIDSTI